MFMRVGRSVMSIELLETISAPHGDVLCSAFSGRLLAIGSSDKLVRLFSFDKDDPSIFSELPQSPLCGHSFGVYGVAFSPSGSTLVSCSQDGILVVWDARTGRRLGDISHESGQSLRVCQFSPDGHVLATGCDDETAAFWDVGSKQMIRSLEGHESSVAALAFTPDGNFLVTGTCQGDLRIWDARFGVGRHMHLEKEAHDLGVTCSAFSPSFGSAAQSGDAATSRHPVSYTLATGGNDDLVKLWRVHSSHAAKVTVSEYTSLAGHTHNVMCLAFAPTGDILASGGGDKTVIVWDPIRGVRLHRLCYHQRYVTTVAFSSDSCLLVSGSNDKHVAVWLVGTDTAHRERQLPGSVSQQQSPVRNLRTREEVEDPFPVFKSNVPVDMWKVDDVVSWLNRCVKVEGYDEIFRKNAIDGQELMLLTDTMLKNSLAVETLGHRNRILRGICALRASDSNLMTNTRKVKHAESGDETIPHEFRCPITHEVMSDPVIAADGYTYERSAITDWLQSHRTSPMTNALLPHLDLTPNRMLKLLIQKRKNQ